MKESQNNGKLNEDELKKLKHLDYIMGVAIEIDGMKFLLETTTHHLESKDNVGILRTEHKTISKADGSFDRVFRIRKTQKHGTEEAGHLYSVKVDLVVILLNLEIYDYVIQDIHGVDLLQITDGKVMISDDKRCSFI